MAQSPLMSSHAKQPINFQHNNKLVGFNARNKDSLSNKYICSICKFLLRNPVQLACEHRFCQSCLAIEQNPTIKCLICNKETASDKVFLDRNCQQDMESLEIVCYACDWNGLFKDYSKHLSNDHIQSICEYCGEKFEEMNLFHNHQSECGKTIINCQLISYGCTEQFLRMDKENHLLSNQHQSIMAKILRETMPSQSNNDDNQHLKSSEMDWTSSKSEPSNSIESTDELKETIDILFGGVQVLNDNTLIHHSEIIRSNCSSNSQSEDLTKLKMSIEETKKCGESLQPNQQILRQDLDSLKQKLEDQISTSYDGTLLWRITDVQKKMVDAQSERQTSVYSPPFYSAPHGYKMCVRLYYYGDGHARGTHMSVFFVLMRGEYDAILQFPFNYKVTFCLFDQTNQQRHIIDSFQPDIKSSSFQRPHYEMNTASGIPNFFPLAVLRQDNNPYVRNDTMFIKTMVHFNETPKTILPYIFNINPGLTPSVQQIMILHEIEKRLQEKRQQTITDTSTTTSIKDEPPS